MYIYVIYMLNMLLSITCTSPLWVQILPGDSFGTLVYLRYSARSESWKCHHITLTVLVCLKFQLNNQTVVKHACMVNKMITNLLISVTILLALSTTWVITFPIYYCTVKYSFKLTYIHVH